MLSVTNGAMIVDAAGREGGAISGEVSDWVDRAGTIASDRQAGAEPLPFASAQAFARFVANWETLKVNPMERAGFALKRRDVLELAVRSVVHDGRVVVADVAGLWGSFDGGMR